MRRIAAAMACLAVVTGAGLPARGDSRVVDKSDNVTRVANFEIGPTTEIAFQGRYAYALSETGVYVIDRKKLKLISSWRCPDGAINDGTEIEPVKPGWIAFEIQPDDDGTCGGLTGVAFLDVRNPRKPKLGGVLPGLYVHTMTPHPSKPLIYVSRNDLAGDFEGGIEHIIDASDPRNPKLSEYLTVGLGCHDVAFGITKRRALAACAGGAETQMWDVSDPMHPVTISRTPTPQIFFNHSVAFTDEARLLAVGDEAHGVNSCTGTPTGALWFYDVSTPETPVLRGYYNIPRGSVASSFWVLANWCTAHMYDFKPKSRLLATAWYQGGMNVLDLSDPAAPTEVAHYRADDYSPWAAYWADDLVWTTDYSGDPGGVEVFEVSGLKD